ncbi:MAG: hypothetical protein JST21_09440 [Bacteroidetes bacterium]|nr:hypothetical protein [Bacteroidota bacterium]
MGIKTRTCFLFASAFFFIHSLQSQVLSNRGVNLNIRQQITFNGSDNWEMGVSSGLSFSLKNNEANLFRGYGIGTKMFGKYYFGKLGISATTGLLSGSISTDAINNFSKERELNKDDIQVVKGNPQNGYFLVGPSLRFGGRFAVNAELQAGLFMNNPGTVDISMKGSDRAIYRFDNGGKNIFPGFSGSIGINYSIGTTTRIFITADYLQSKTSINYLDMKNGFDIATKLNRDVKIMFAGIGVIKTFGCGRKQIEKRLAVIKNEDSNLKNDYTDEKQSAQDYKSSLPGKIYFSIGTNGAIAGELNTDEKSNSSPVKSYLIIGDDGTLTGKLNAQDFNTCRNNHVRGMGFTTHSQNNSLTDAQLANDNNAPTLGKVYFSVSEDGAIAGELNTDEKSNSSPVKSYLIIGDNGTLTGKLNAQDFNTCRNNHVRGNGK